MLVKIFGKVNKMLCVKIDTVSGKRETEQKIIEENRGGTDRLSNKDLSMRNKETENSCQLSSDYIIIRIN